MTNGTEIRLYDRDRRPPNWTDAIAPSQYAVLLRDAISSTPHRADGTACVDPSAATCVVFDSVDAAEHFARERVHTFPSLCADVFDAEGRANPPLLTVTAAGALAGADASRHASRRRRILAGLLVAVAAPLVWLDWAHDFSLVFPMFFGLGAMVAAVRLLQWDLGARAQALAQRQRLDACRRRPTDV